MKRRFSMWLVPACSILFTAGCHTSLDKKQAELIRTWSITNQMFARSISTYHEVMSSALAKHYARVRDAENEKFKAWVARQVHDGHLVLTDDNDVPILDAGKYQPMEYAALESAYDTHLETLAKIERDEERFLRIDAEIAAAIKQFERLSQLNLEQSEAIAEAKASAQQLLESSLSIIAGLAAAAVASG